MHRIHGDATTEIEDVTIGEPLGVGPWHVVEFVEDCPLERVTGLASEAVHLHQPVNALCTDEVGFVNVQLGVGEQSVAGHVVFVAVGVDDGVDLDGRPTLFDHGDRGVDHHGLASAAHEQSVARRICAVGVSNQDTHRVGQSSFAFAPVDDHGGDASQPNAASRIEPRSAPEM